MLYEARGALVTDRRTVAKFCKSIGGVPLANHNFRAESLFFCSGSALAAIRGCSSTSTLAQLGYTESTVYVLWSETTVYSSYAIRAECAHSLSRLSQNGTSSSYTTMLCTLQWLKGLSKAKAKRAKKISQIFRYPSHLHICQWKRTIWNFLRIYINWIFEYWLELFHKTD